MITSNNIFKNTITPFIRNTLRNNFKLYYEYHSLNDKKTPRLEKSKAILFQKKNLLEGKPRIFSTRNQKILMKLNKNIKSAKIKPSVLNKDIFHPIKLKQDKMSNTGISFYRKNCNNLKRNCSSYYIKGDLSLGQKYISDFLINSEEKKKKGSKISEIDKKISKLGRKLNLYFLGKNNSFQMNRSFSSFPQTKRDIRKKMNEYEINKSKNNENENIKNDSGEKTSLPDYLKNEFNIKGTNILSPFCIKARDDYILKKFSQYFDERYNLKSDNKYINNKLNIIYAENEDAYNMKLSLLNKKLNEQGKIDKYHIGFSPSEQLLRDMEKKVTWMKKVVEYAYPNTTLMRMRVPENKKFFKKYKYKYEFKKFEIEKDKLNEIQSNFYKLPNNSDLRAKNKSHRKKFSHVILYK